MDHAVTTQTSVIASDNNLYQLIYSYGKLYSCLQTRQSMPNIRIKLMASVPNWMIPLSAVWRAIEIKLRHTAIPPISIHFQHIHRKAHT